MPYTGTMAETAKTERSVAGIIVRDGKVFLAQRDGSGSFTGYWEFPGGKVEGDESDAEALEREFLEEFGVGVRALRPLGETKFTHHGRERTLSGWLAEFRPGPEPVLRAHFSVRWVGPEELKSLPLVDSDARLVGYVLPLIL